MFNWCVAARSINIDKNKYQHVCNCTPGVLLVDSYKRDRVMVFDIFEKGGKVGTSVFYGHISSLAYIPLFSSTNWHLKRYYMYAQF